MIKIFTVAEMQAVEAAADAAGVTYAAMMETAGRRVAEAIQVRHDVAGRSVLVLVGPGNNGGDGLVTARYLAEAGADVAVYLTHSRPEDDPNLLRVRELGLFVLEAALDQRYRVLRTRLNITDIVVDAILGTGVSRPISGDLAALMRQAGAGVAARRAAVAEVGSAPLHNVAALQSSPPEPAADPAPLAVVVAVDCPSGLNCDSGALDPLAIEADLTVTFAGPKRGHFRFPGAAACGDLVVADIGIPSDLPELAAVNLTLATPDLVRQWLPARPADGHKGTFGNVLVVAGSGGYWGAPALAGRAAYRAGAGLVGVATPTAVRPTVVPQLPEATYPQVRGEVQLDAADLETLADLAGDWAAWLVGPGLGDAGAFVGAMLDAAGDLPPLVIDADGLNALARQERWPGRLPAGTILTPHPGEMARLMGLDLAELKELDRVTVARDQAAAWEQVIVLKGAYTIVAAPNGRAVLVPIANPALATAGSGDILAGIIAGLLAQRADPFEAAALGAWLHAAAGTRAAVGDAGLLAGEIAEWVPVLRRDLR